MPLLPVCLLFDCPIVCKQTASERYGASTMCPQSPSAGAAGTSRSDWRPHSEIDPPSRIDTLLTAPSNVDRPRAALPHRRSLVASASGCRQAFTSKRANNTLYQIGAKQGPRHPRTSVGCRGPRVKQKNSGRRLAGGVFVIVSVCMHCIIPHPVYWRNPGADFLAKCLCVYPV